MKWIVLDLGVKPDAAIYDLASWELKVGAAAAAAPSRRPTAHRQPPDLFSALRLPQSTEDSSRMSASSG